MSGSFLERYNLRNINNAIFDKCVDFCVNAREIEAEYSGKNLSKLDKQINKELCIEECHELLFLLEYDKEFKEEILPFLKELFDQ